MRLAPQPEHRPLQSSLQGVVSSTPSNSSSTTSGDRSSLSPSWLAAALLSASAPLSNRSTTRRKSRLIPLKNSSRQRGQSPVTPPSSRPVTTTSSPHSCNSAATLSASSKCWPVHPGLSASCRFMPATGSENSTRLGTDPRSAMRTSILAYKTRCLPHRNASTAAHCTPSCRGRQRIN